MTGPVSYTHLDVYKRQMNGQALAAMKPGAVLLNFARGGLIEDDAVLALSLIHIFLRLRRSGKSVGKNRETPCADSRIPRNQL